MVPKQGALSVAEAKIEITKNRNNKMSLSINASVLRVLLSIRLKDFPSSPEFLSLSEVPGKHPAVGALEKHLGRT